MRIISRILNKSLGLHHSKKEPSPFPEAPPNARGIPSHRGLDSPLMFSTCYQAPKNSLESLPSLRAQDNARELSPFSELPIELLILIIHYLPIEAVASLSLSCHSLYSCLKPGYLQSLKDAEYSAMNKFLHLLERDLPAHIVCPECNKLHYIQLAEHHLASKLYDRPSKNVLKCRVADSNSTVHYIGKIPPGFSTTIFRMAMKAHRQGDDTTEILSLLSHRELNYLWGFVKLHTVEARIFDNSLFIREQKVYMIPPSQKTPTPWYGSIGVCRHIIIPEISQLYWYGIRVSRGDEIYGYKNQQGLISCKKCHTEFRVDFKSYRGMGNAMFVTRWMDYGEGQGYDPVLSYQRGSICAAFERSVDFQFDSTLTEEDREGLYKESPWLWPEDERGDRGELYGSPHYMVSEGRIVSLY